MTCHGIGALTKDLSVVAEGDFSAECQHGVDVSARLATLRVDKNAVKVKRDACKIHTFLSPFILGLRRSSEERNLLVIAFEPT